MKTNQTIGEKLCEMGFELDDLKISIFNSLFDELREIPLFGGILDMFINIYDNDQQMDEENEDSFLDNIGSHVLMYLEIYFDKNKKEFTDEKKDLTIDLITFFLKKFSKIIRFIFLVFENMHQNDFKHGCGYNRKFHHSFGSKKFDFFGMKNGMPSMPMYPPPPPPYSPFMPMPPSPHMHHMSHMHLFPMLPRYTPYYPDHPPYHHHHRHHHHRKGDFMFGNSPFQCSPDIDVGNNFDSFDGPHHPVWGGFQRKMYKMGKENCNHGNQQCSCNSGCDSEDMTGNDCYQKVLKAMKQRFEGNIRKNTTDVNEDKGQNESMCKMNPKFFLKMMRNFQCCNSSSSSKTDDVIDKNEKTD
eukprot:TRINITY_DN2854_c0_g2_i1.p2 TRINITY_DN2854_c0_g2~~TRINITY_DN2854_c0_g2_i1.p2  ORF type:complete len:356 (+),score=100.95 TRINITY_DN2854_c0_g2_i1:49-1116(+)